MTTTDTAEVTVDDVIEAIMAGDLDEGLNRIDTAVDNRKKVAVRNIPRGTPVRITDGIRPKYFAGMTGKFVSAEGKQARITLDPEHRTVASRYVNPLTGEVRVPVAVVETI